jgi:hypothetical protein
VLLGAALGLPVGWVASVFLPVQGKRYVLTRKLDTIEADPFESGEPPVRADLKPGSEVRVVFRKWRVLYLQMNTVVLESDLLRATDPDGD